MVISFHQNNTCPCYGKCFSNRCPHWDTNSDTAAACGPIQPMSTLAWSGLLHQSRYKAGCNDDSVQDGYRILLLQVGGYALASPKGGGPCSLSTRNYLVALHLAYRICTGIFQLDMAPIGHGGNKKQQHNSFI